MSGGASVTFGGLDSTSNLSVTFGSSGNPGGRAVDRLRARTRLRQDHPGAHLCGAARFRAQPGRERLTSVPQGDKNAHTFYVQTVVLGPRAR